MINTLQLQSVSRKNVTVLAFVGQNWLPYVFGSPNYFS